MAQLIINIGTAADSGDGTPNRTSWSYANANFTELYNLVTLTDAKATFTVESDDTLAIPASTSPAYMTGLMQVGTLTGMTLDEPTGSVINTSGRTLNMTGSLSFQLVRDTVGGDTSLWFYSERSSDGITWVKNTSSLRKIVISKDGVDYKSGFSFTQSPWADGDYFRFQFAASTAGRIEFIKQSETFNGDLVESHSLIWNMSEH